MSVNHIYDLELIINDIQRYCTNDWLRLCIDDGLRNKSRWKTHRVWGKIQEIKFGNGDYTGITRDVDKTILPDMNSIYLNITGYLTTYAAIKGDEKINEKMVLDYWKELKKFLKEYTKDSHSYSDWEEYVKTKINLKKRKFNMKSD